MPSRKPTQERIEQVKTQFQAAESKILEISKEPDKERHFRLLYNVALEAVDADLSKTAYRLWIYLSANYPFSDREVDLPSQTELGIRLGVTRQAINIAAAELQQAGLWDFWAERWMWSNLKGFGTPKEEGVKKNRQVSKKNDTVSKENDTRCQKKMTPCKENLTPCKENLTPTTLEPLPQADSKTPHTSSDFSDLNQTTTDKDDAAAVEKIYSNPNSPICQPTQEEVERMHQEIARISPEIQLNAQVKKAVLQFWANLPAAIAHTKKAVQEDWKCKSLTAVFVSALKNPPEDARSAARTATEPQKEWKCDDDWSQHPEYERWLKDAYRGRWQWVNEPGLTKADRIPRGYFLEWCEDNNAFSVFSEGGKT